MIGKKAGNDQGLKTKSAIHFSSIFLDYFFIIKRIMYLIWHCNLMWWQQGVFFLLDTPVLYDLQNLTIWNIGVLKVIQLIAAGSTVQLCCHGYWTGGASRQVTASNNAFTIKLWNFPVPYSTACIDVICFLSVLFKQIYV